VDRKITRRLRNIIDALALSIPEETCTLIAASIKAIMANSAKKMVSAGDKGPLSVVTVPVASYETLIKPRGVSAMIDIIIPIAPQEHRTNRFLVCLSPRE
jgi:hypothetical protein